MTIQDLGSIGELVAAIATVATLVYLAVQIRQNTQALRGTFHDSSVARAQGWFLAIASDRDLSSIYHRVLQGDELTDEEENRFHLLMSYFLLGTETAYYQHTRGNADPQLWQGQLARLRLVLSRPGFRTWWDDNSRPRLTDSFESLIELELRASERDP